MCHNTSLIIKLVTKLTTCKSNSYTPKMLGDRNIWPAIQRGCGFLEAEVRADCMHWSHDQDNKEGGAAGE